MSSVVLFSLECLIVIRVCFVIWDVNNKNEHFELHHMRIVKVPN